MAFGSPFGMGYGLGEAGAAVGQGLLRGQIMAPQLQYEQLRNQQMQNELASNKALATTAAPTATGPEDPMWTPFSQAVADQSAQLQALRQAGQGEQANRLAQELSNNQQHERAFRIGQTAKMLLYSPDVDTPQVKQLIKATGLGSPQKILRNQDGSVTFIGANGQPTNMSIEQLERFATPPEQLGQVASLMGYRQGMLGVKERQAETQEKRVQGQIQNWADLKDYRAAHLTSQEKIALGHDAARVQAAGIAPAMRYKMFREAPEQATYDDLTTPVEEGGHGMSNEDALAFINSGRALRANPKKYDPAQAADALTKVYVSKLPKEVDAKTAASMALDFRTRVAPRLLGTPGAAPSAPAAAPRTPPAAPAIPAALKGAPKEVVDAYLAGKPVRDPKGNRYIKPTP